MDSKTVFELRNQAKSLSGIEKLNKLLKTVEVARELYSKIPYDEWIQKALAHTLIDLCKYYIAENKLNQAEISYSELNSINFQGNKDEIIENQKTFLLPKIDANYSNIKKAEELSKNGNNNEALLIFKNLISQNRLTEIHHESYGWILYRYLKSEEHNLASIDVRKILRDYMNLKNDRPSMLHSMFLNFALNYSKSHSDFKFYSFFLLWNPENLRNEDLNKSYKDGKEIPSLISRICREFVNSETEFIIDDFLNNIKLSKESVLDLLREPFFWHIFNVHKEEKFSELWDLFEKYNSNYSKYGQSKWHSDILNLAERFMIENDEWRFLEFFKKWNPENLRSADWKETKKEENTYKPLATKAIKKAFEVLKNKTSDQDISWLIKSYETAIKFFPDDEWLLREKALLHFKNNEKELAIKIYKHLVLELADKHYVWQEFSNCIISDNLLKIGMLSKALSLEKNEDFLGDIHLDLAKILIEENLFENVLVELEVYKKHREIKGWKISSLYDDLSIKASVVKRELSDNRELYNKYIPLAESFAYSDLDWTEVLIVDKWKDDKGKERLTFTDGKNIEFSIGKTRLELLRQSEVGEVFKFKLHKQEIKKEVESNFPWYGKTLTTEFKYIPLIVEKSDKKQWDILEDTFAYVDYVNKEKKIIHAITKDNKEVFFPQTKNELQIGDFVKAKVYTKKVKNENRTELRQIQKTDKSSVISKFQTKIAIVDGVNEQKQLFHFKISYDLQGIVKYTETSIRPEEGIFIKLSFATKIGKDGKRRVRILGIEPTNEINQNLRKDITGLLEVKYKNGNYPDYYIDDENQSTDSDIEENKNFLNTNKPIPDFAFIGDYYVPKHLLEKQNITSDCRVKARLIDAGIKWKVISIEKF